MEKRKIVAIVGPTASGKTALSILLAQRLGGEVLSGDSMQIYRHMDIGTAKPTPEERQGIPHHLIDILEPDQSFSVAQYCTFAKEALNQVDGLPILAGGTGLYIDSFLTGNSFAEIREDRALREELTLLAQREGGGALKERLARVDPESAQRLHENDILRLVRALEVYETTGRTISYWNRLSRTAEPPYQICWLGLCTTERQILYDRINQRVDEMLEQGLWEEVEWLLHHYRLSDTARNAIGYKELIEAAEGRAERDSAVEQIKQNTRRYAKRQLTWFRRNERICWFQLDSRKELEKIGDLAAKQVAKSLDI